MRMLNRRGELMPAVCCPPCTESDQPEENMMCATINPNNLNAVLSFAIGR
jgi:hypothetical protein